MSVNLKPLRDQVIVITGASSGIGLATARAAAQQGAKLVLTARNEEALADVEKQITAAGGQAIHVAADVGRRDQLQRVADAAVLRFGGFDTWVNNAGGSIFGRLEEVSDEDHRQLFETNFWGVVYGSLVAAEHLKERGGALINLGSVLSDISMPIQGMYSASKHAVKGFTDALRMELEEEGAPVSVTLIKPTSINTPFPHRARNYTDREPKLPDPVYQPEEVAHVILHAAAHPQRDVYVGGASIVWSLLGHAAPRTMDWLSETVMPGQQKRAEAPQNPAGTLYQPGHDGHAHGDHPNYVMRRSLYTRAALHPFRTGLVIAAAGLALGALMSAGRA